MLVDPFADIPPSLRGGIIAIGNFEGIHRGHCRLLATLRQRARDLGVPAIAVSFDPHPLRLLRPDSAPSSLVWTDRKVDLLLQSGADGVAILKTTREFLALSAKQFFHDIVISNFRAVGMVEGRNFCYGKARGGDVDLLARQCRDKRLSLDVVDIVSGKGESEVSSTRIRRELASGEVETANSLLGRPHRLIGTVVAGDRRGSTLGFPTANLTDIPVILPNEGVYACRAIVNDEVFAAACNIGPNPTFGVAARKVEVHLIGFHGDLYGKTLEIDLLKRIRDVKSFPGIDALKSQLLQDVAEAQRICEEWRHPFGSDLGQTVTQWLLNEVQPALSGIDATIEHADLSPNGELTIQSHVQPVNLPNVSLDLMTKMDGRLQKTFPEIRGVRWVQQPVA